MCEHFGISITCIASPKTKKTYRRRNNYIRYIVGQMKNSNGEKKKKKIFQDFKKDGQNKNL